MTGPPHARRLSKDAGQWWWGGGGNDQRPLSPGCPLDQDPTGRARPSRAGGRTPRGQRCLHSGRAPDGWPTPTAGGGWGRGFPITVRWQDDHGETVVGPSRQDEGRRSASRPVHCLYEQGHTHEAEGGGSRPWTRPPWTRQ